MDIDAGADDFFAALNSGDADGFVDFGLVPVPDAPDVALPVASSTSASASDEQVRSHTCVRCIRRQ